MSEHPVQLRIGFTAPADRADIHLTLSGRVVLADTTGGLERVLDHLRAVGIVARPHPGGVAFPVTALARAAGLPDHVAVHTDEDLAPLWLLATHPPAVPATVDVDGPILRLSWHDGTCRCDEPLTLTAAVALAASELPFVATPAAWDRIRTKLGNLPTPAGRARWHPDGYVTITTGAPQRLEHAGIRALFRIDDTTFGVPAAYTDTLSDVEGLVWEGRRHHPAPTGSPARVLAATHGIVLAGATDPARRRAAVDLLATLDARPVLVVTTAAHLWAWTQTLRRPDARHAGHDAHVVTYAEIDAGVSAGDVAAVVFDDADRALDREPATGRRLRAVTDIERIATVEQWPDQPARQVALAALVRPCEFDPDIPVEVRYPGGDQRAREHTGAYLASVATPGAPGAGPDVVVVDVGDETRRAIDRLAGRRDRPPAALLADAADLLAAGPTHATGPKLAAAVELARTRAGAGERVAVLCRSPRTARLVAALARPGAVVDGDCGQLAVDLADDTPVVAVTFNATVPNLARFDTVIVVDRPHTDRLLDAAVAGVANVVVVHADHPVDDALATATADIDGCWPAGTAAAVATAAGL